MLARVLTCALALCAVAPSALAQQTENPFFQVSPESAPARRPADIGRGRIDFQNPAQQRLVEAALPRIERAVAAQLANPGSAELRSLRTGRYQKTMIVCGVVDSIAASGETEKRRFIARPDVATLETPENSQAFRAGWKSTGCGF